ncbi:MAG: CinA family protein [Candidatus Lokiarchaeota archaeon]|nr:CinA family protein [Candidatus Lokiarchaeota archaeon]
MEELKALAYEVVESLKAANLRLGLAESMTGGLIGHLITNIDGASRVFLGGHIVYSAEAKCVMLNIPMEDIHSLGTVSKELTQMMLNQMTELPTDINLAITGIAGQPIEGLPRGTVFIGTNCCGNVIINKYQYKGTREEIKQQAAIQALNLILDYLQTIR